MGPSERWVHAVFESRGDARDALRELAAAGIAAAHIEVRSSIPLPDLRPAGSEPRTRVPLMAILGGLLGGTGAFLLTSLTSQAYPLPTGGMPIVPLPPSAIITFEGVAVGAILCTVGTMLYEGGLLRLRMRPRPLDAHLAAGRIIVSVRSADLRTGAWTARAVVIEEEGEGEPSRR